MGPVCCLTSSTKQNTTRRTSERINNESGIENSARCVSIKRQLPGFLHPTSHLVSGFTVDRTSIWSQSQGTKVWRPPDNGPQLGPFTPKVSGGWRMTGHLLNDIIEVQCVGSCLCLLRTHFNNHPSWPGMWQGALTGWAFMIFGCYSRAYAAAESLQITGNVSRAQWSA